MMTWLQELIQAYTALGGEADYEDVYNYIKNHTSRELKGDWQATIRKEVKRHSSHSRLYKNTRPDVFYSAGIGTGRWGLNSQSRVNKGEITYTKTNSNRDKETLNENPDVYLVNSDHDVSLDNDGEENQEIDEAEVIPAIDIEEPVVPNKIRSTTTRIIRDTKKSNQLKSLYNNCCQICEETIQLQGRDYSEGHHLQPVGGEHNGPDIKANIIVVCPNHHVEFDYGAIAIDPDTLEITHVDKSNEFIGKKLTVHPGHRVSRDYLVYHLNEIFKGKR